MERQKVKESEDWNSSMAYDNIEKLGALLGEKEIGALQRAVVNGEKQLSELLKKLGDMEGVLMARRMEEAARRKEEEARAEREAAEAKRAAEKQAAEEKEKASAPAPAPVPVPEEKEIKAEVRPAEAKPAAAKPAEAKPVFRPEERPRPQQGGARPSYNNNAQRP